MDNEELKKFIELSTIPLTKIDKNNNNKPIGSASGFKVRYNNKLYLITANHVLQQGEWGMECKYEKWKGAKLVPVPYKCAYKFSLGKIDAINNMYIDNPELLDFNIIPMPEDIKSYYQEFDQDRNPIVEIERKIFDTFFDSTPSKFERYGFTGRIKPKLDGISWEFEQKTYMNLKFIEIKNFENGFIYVFRLPFPVHNIDKLKGCSGAPIIDTQGNVVAVISRQASPQRIEAVSVNIGKFVNIFR